MRASNLDDGRFMALLSATDAQSGQPVGTREFDFRYRFPPPMVAEFMSPVEAPPPVISVDLEASLIEPPAIEVAWAPPPMLVEMPPPQPGPRWFWAGGFWTWQGEWVWVNGHWRE